MVHFLTALNKLPTPFATLSALDANVEGRAAQKLG
jgi:hypothetical protein